MVSSVSGYQTGNIDYTKWRTKSITEMAVPVHAQISQPIQQEGDNAQLSNSSSEKCTDGKDDGKIGFFGAIGNMIKGAAKTVVDGVKGMFTGKDGKFSLGKTLLSLGTAALCIACPAVGVAACAIGGTMGAIQLGKGIYNAATAKTDAEAKEAWQNVGGGALTVGMSYAGAKAGLKAMKSSSNTALANVDDAISNTDDALKLTNKSIDDVVNNTDDVLKLSNNPFDDGINNTDDVLKLTSGTEEDIIGKTTTSAAKDSFNSTNSAREAVLERINNNISDAKSLIAEYDKNPNIHTRNQVFKKLHTDYFNKDINDGYITQEDLTDLVNLFVSFTNHVK